jgi:SAM-dependent methyltransferase
MSDFDQEYFKTYALPKFVKMKTANLRGFIDYLNVPKKKGRALDIGSGYGYSSTICVEYGYTVYSTDISLYALNQAKKISQAEDMIVCDAQNLPFTEAFDLVMCFEVLEHLKIPEKTLKNAFQAFNPGGLFVASTPNPLTRSHWDAAHQDPTHISLKGAKEWKSILEDCGFCNVKVSNVHFIPALWRLTGKLTLVRLGQTMGNYILMSATKP